MEKKSEMIRLRNEGLTYREIAEKFGTTRQNVHGLIGRRRRGTTAWIVRPRLREWFDGTTMSIPTFASIVFGYKARENKEKMTNFLKGRDSRFTVPQVSRLCALTGLSIQEILEEEK